MIPVGLMSPTAQRNARVNGSSPDQGYWQGDRFIAPSYPLPKPSLMSPDVAKAVQAVKDNAEKAQALAIASSNIFGDGPQGEGIGAGKGGQQDQGAPTGAPSGSAPTGTPNANVQDMMDQGIPGVQATVGQPGTMSPAPTPNVADQQTAPAPAPEAGTNTSGRTSTQTTNTQAATRGMTPQEMRDKMEKATPTDFMEAMKGLMAATANPGISGGLTSPAGLMDTMNEQGKTPAEKGPGPGMGAASPSGSGPSGEGLGPDGTPDAPGPGGIGAGGNTWRKGGPTGNDGDRNKDEVAGSVHENEFVLNRPMVSLMQQTSPGLLERLNAFQHGLMASKPKPRGLMGR